MTKSKKKIILLTTSLILTICLMAFFGVYALTILKNSTFNVGVKYEPEYLVKVEMGIDGANDGTVNQNIEENEYVEIFNSLTPVSNGMYIDSMSNETIHINSQTLTPIGVNGDVYFRITSLENETSAYKNLKCVIDCGSSTVDSGILAINIPKELTIATGIDATSGTVTSSSLGMIKISFKFSEFILDFIDLKNLVSNSSAGLDFGELGMVTSSDITGKTFYVSNIDGLLNLSALVGQVNTTTTEYGSNYGYDNSSGPARTFSGATIQMLNNIDFKNGDNKDNFSNKFIPIGNEANSFQGTFDGNNKTITSLYINQTTNSAGLFGRVSNAEIKNLTMQNCKVVSIDYYVGNFVGFANHNLTISNCSAEETEVSGTFDVSGIVGYARGPVTITNCYNTGSVSGTGDYVGGIVGRFYGSVTITNCYNTGSVSGNYYVGGIIGACLGEAVVNILNCYNTNQITGEGYGGGIIGLCDDGTINVFNNFNAGTVKVNSYYVGGIIGVSDKGVSDNGVILNINNCYNTGSLVDNGTNLSRGGILGYIWTATVTIKNSYCSNVYKVIGNAENVNSSSSYGTFTSATSNVVKTSSANLVYSGNILNVLNAYRKANPTYNGITLNTWVAGSNGYPVFA